MNSLPFRSRSLALALLAAASSSILGAAIPKYDQRVPSGPPAVNTVVTLRSAPIQVVTPQLPLITNLNPGTTLTLALGVDAAAIESVKWYKDDREIPATSNILTIAGVTTADSGIYMADVMLKSGATVLLEKLTVRVETPVRLRLLNLSTRVTLSATQRTVMSGFVVSPVSGKLNETKALLIRAIGPALAGFGITDALPDPDVQVFDAAGNEVPASPTAAVYGELFKDVPTLVGAFPLTPGTKDRFYIYALPGGVYSARLSSVGGATGTALLEIYDVPELF